MLGGWGRVKKKDIREIVSNQKPDLLRLRETKPESVDRKLCSKLWGDDEFEWVAKNSVGRAGGMIVLWKKGSFSLFLEFQGDNFLGAEGVWGSEQLGVIIVNVYAPCDMRGKKLLWEELVSCMEARGGNSWCVLGEFNSIKSPVGRKRVDGYDRSDEMQCFGEFISRSGLIDLPLIGRKYTWYKLDGKAMSRLDRFLISEGWLNS